MIVGDKVRLRAHERVDLPDYVRWLNDRDVTRTLLLHRPMSMAEEERWFESLAERTDSVGFSIDALDGDEWVHVGTTSLEATDWRNRLAEFGIFIGEKKYWDRGHGTEATRLVVTYGFDELNLHRIGLQVYDFNKRAAEIYERIGFKKEGVLREAMFREGSYHDVQVMGLLREEYDAAAVSS